MPTQPTIALTDLHTGTTATATVTGDAGSTIDVLGCRSGSADGWVKAGTRTGPGTVSVTGLTNGAVYVFIAVAETGGEYAEPSDPTFLTPSATSTTDPVAEQILAALKTQLETITTGHGYSQTVTVVRPTRTDGVTPANNTIVLKQEGQPTDVENAAIQHVHRQLRVACQAMVMTDETETIPVDTRINRIVADIEKCVNADDTLGGLADWIDVGEIDGFEPRDGSIEGATVHLSIGYRTLRTDPYSRG